MPVLKHQIPLLVPTKVSKKKSQGWRNIRSWCVKCKKKKSIGISNKQQDGQYFHPVQSSLRQLRSLKGRLLSAKPFAPFHIWTKKHFAKDKKTKETFFRTLPFLVLFVVYIKILPPPFMKEENPYPTLRAGIPWSSIVPSLTAWSCLHKSWISPEKVF